MQNFGLSGDYTSLIYGLEGIQGAKPITYTYMYGTKTYTWQPSPTHGADIYIVNFDNTNGFNEWHDLPDKTFQPNQTVFRTIFWGTNAQGNISGAIATQDISKLDDSEIRLLALFHVASVLDGATTNVTGAGYGPFLQFLLGYAAKDTIPYIQIQK